MSGDGASPSCSGSNPQRPIKRPVCRSALCSVATQTGSAAAALRWTEKPYHLSKNENGSTLHGAAVGFDKVIWEVVDVDTMRLVLRHVSPDGDQGFPGEVTATATYRLDSDTLWLDFDARTTKPTP